MGYTRKKKGHSIKRKKIYKGGNLPLVSVYLMCYNEERLIDFTVNYYKKQFPNCIITICDNESSDKSVEIAKGLGCLIHTYKTDGVFSETALMDLRNSIWKTASTPWVIVCDMDEILTANQKDIISEQEKGTTILKTKGYDLIGDSKKEDLSNIKTSLDTITSGFYSSGYSKSICFNRTKISDINFSGGSHSADPKGDVKYSEKEYLLYHYKKLGYEYYKFTHSRSQPRAKKALDRKIFSSIHYTLNENTLKTNMDKSQIKNLESIPPLKSFYLNYNTQLKGGSNNLKVAIIFSGRIKGYENVKDKVLHIKNKYNATVFCSLNKKNKSDYINNFCKTFDIRDHQLNLELTNTPDWIMKLDKPEVTSYEGTYSMFYHTRKAFDLITAYQQSNKMQFDCVIFFRADIDEEDEFNIQSPIENTIYIPEGEDYGGICGIIAYGNYNSMDKYSNLVNCIDYICRKQKVVYHPETMLKQHLSNESLAIERFPYKYKLHHSRKEHNPAYNNIE